MILLTSFLACTSNRDADVPSVLASSECYCPPAITEVKVTKVETLEAVAPPESDAPMEDEFLPIVVDGVVMEECHYKNGTISCHAPKKK